MLGAALCLMAATLPLTLLMTGPAAAGRPALVVAPPWGPGVAAVIAAAGGREIAPRAAPMAQLAVLDHPSRALAAGAWAVLDARALASLCGIEGDPE